MTKHYKILGLNKNASLEEIRRAYRIKVMQMHPDKGGSDDDFIELHEAYLFLIDRDDSPPSSFKQIEMEIEEEDYWPIVQLIGIASLFLLLTLKYCTT